MYLKPCRTCSETKDCEIYKEMRQKLKGTGLTSAAFHCKKLQGMYHIGQRVKVLFSKRFEYCTEDASGVVTNIRNNSKIVIYCDIIPFYLEDEFGNLELVKSKNNFISMWPKYVEPTDEPDVACCPECGRPATVENKPGWHCGACPRTEIQGELIENVF